MQYGSAMPAVRRLRLPVPVRLGGGVCIPACRAAACHLLATSVPSPSPTFPGQVNIVTGSLASGKTTFIGALLRQKPEHEVWAVLVNEFGAAGLDAALLEGSRATHPAPASTAEAAGTAGCGSSGSSVEGIHIKQLAGGCLCCALSNVTALAIAQLLRSVKPDRCVAALKCESPDGATASLAAAGRQAAGPATHTELAGLKLLQTRSAEAVRCELWRQPANMPLACFSSLPCRLLIEPSGLAHPAALVDMLQGEHLGRSLVLQPVVCLVSARWQLVADITIRCTAL